MKKAKNQMIFFLTCIALLWFEQVDTPKSAPQQMAWQANAAGG